MRGGGRRESLPSSYDTSVSFHCLYSCPINPYVSPSTPIVSLCLYKPSSQCTACIPMKYGIAIDAEIYGDSLSYRTRFPHIRIFLLHGYYSPLDAFFFHRIQLFLVFYFLIFVYSNHGTLDHLFLGIQDED